MFKVINMVTGFTYFTDNSFEACETFRKKLSDDQPSRHFVTVPNG